MKSFIEICPVVSAHGSTQTDRHTDRQTDRQTDTQTDNPGISGPRRSQYIQSMKMTECKNTYSYLLTHIHKHANYWYLGRYFWSVLYRSSMQHVLELRDIRVQGPPRISRSKKSARYPRGARYPLARSSADISYEISAGCEISACYSATTHNPQSPNLPLV